MIIMKKFLFPVFLAAVMASGCNKDEVVTQQNPMAPQITLDSDPDEYGIYTTKVGRQLTIALTYRYVENAVYSWRLQTTGRIISTEPTLEYTFASVNETDEAGYYLTLEVTNRNGTSTEELLVQVLELTPPTIRIDEQVEVVRKHEYEFTPDVQAKDISEFEWTLRAEGEAEAHIVGTAPTYVFCAEELGHYELTLSTKNEDGSDRKTVDIEVVNALAISATVAPIGNVYDGTKRTVALGRTLPLRPYIWNAIRPTYSWTIDGKEVGTDLMYIYTPTEEGTKKIVFTVSDTSDESEAGVSRHVASTGRQQATLEFTVECHKEEGTYKRPATASSSVNWTKVFEYTPAPGQFINELATGGFSGDETTPEAAVAYAESRLERGIWVSLGGWGGYIVVGFDHSIENSDEGYRDGYNFSIQGNQFKGSSEPGIVWVMQDTNGNTLPDDEWYELKGSEYGKEETIQDYAVTYYRPAYPGADVQWKDNRGAKGCIDYLAQFHTQSCYYPNWVDADDYVLYGTCLKSRTYDQSGNGSYWVNDSYDWGYVDNFGEDRLSNDENAGAGACKTYFKISNAVKADGTPADLKYIDFIKVQTGVNVKAGWLGENSTEVFGFTDENINQGKK